MTLGKEVPAFVGPGGGVLDRQDPGGGLLFQPFPGVSLEDPGRLRQVRGRQRSLPVESPIEPERITEVNRQDLRHPQSRREEPTDELLPLTVRIGHDDSFFDVWATMLDGTEVAVKDRGRRVAAQDRAGSTVGTFDAASVERRSDRRRTRRSTVHPKGRATRLRPRTPRSRAGRRRRRRWQPGTTTRAATARS